MSRKIFLFLLVFALAVGTLSVRATPTVAASSTDSNTAFADLLPADVAVYANLRTANLQDTVGIITDLIGRLAGIKPTKPYQQIDDGLTQLLGRDASVEKDILPWLGDNVAAAYLISDADLAAMQKNGATAMMQSQEALIIVGVKDQAKGDVFLKQVLSAITRMSPNMLSGTAKTITLNGASASEYVGPQGTLVQGKGFYAIGQSAAVNEMIDAVSNSKPTLAADPDFWATMKLLKTNNLPGTASVGHCAYDDRAWYARHSVSRRTGWRNKSLSTGSGGDQRTGAGRTYRGQEPDPRPRDGDRSG